MKKLDLSTKKWGRLSFVRDDKPDEYVRPDGKIRTERRAIFQCDCGEFVSLPVQNVRTSNTKSCGCFRVEHSKSINLKHGDARSDTYRIYRHMINRCYNPNVERYPFYGGRGVSVADEWRGDGGYERWLQHMGARPSKSHSIDRIDNNGNYEPGNVRWATTQEQVRNRSCSLTCILDDKVVSVFDAAKIVGLTYNTLRQRLKTGRSLPQGVRKHTAD